MAKSFIVQAQSNSGESFGGSVRYIEFGTGGGLTNNTTSSGVRIPACTIDDISCRVVTNTLVGADATITLVKNSIDTGLSLTIPASGQPVGEFSGTGSVSFSDGDKVVWKVDTTGGSGSIELLMLGASVDTGVTSDALTLMLTNGGSSSDMSATSATYFLKPVGLRGSNTDETELEMESPIAGDLSYLNVQLATVSKSTDFYARVAGVNSAVTASATASDSSALLTDMTHTASISARDRLSIAGVTPAAAGSMNVSRASLALKTTNKKFMVAVGDYNYHTHNDGLTYYYPVGGSLPDSLVATESRAEYSVPFDCNVSEIFIRLVESSMFSSSTMRLRKNGVSVGTALIIPSAGVGYHYQAVDVDFSAGDTICLEITTGSSGTRIRPGYMGVVAQEAAGGAALVVGGLSQGQSLGGATLTQKHSLAPAGLSQTQTIGSAALTQAHVLYVDNVAQVSALENVLLTQAHSLAVSSLQQIQSIDGVTLTQAHALAVARIDQAQAIGNAALIQAHQLVVDAIDQAQTIGGVTLSQAGSLDVQDAGQTQSLGSVTLTQAHVIAVAGIAQQQAIDQAAITQAHSLSVDGVSQAQSIESISLAVAGSLAAHDIAHGQTLSGITLTQAGVLSVDDAAQAQSIDAATLTQHYALAVQGLLQNTTISNVTLTEGSLALVVGDINQTQTIDQPALTAHSVLSVDDMTQSQILATVLLGGTVIGSLDGELVMYALMDGEVVTRTLLSADVAINTIH